MVLPMHIEQSQSVPLAAVVAAMQERIVTSTSYFGVRTQKNPLDFWVYQELITATRPDVIVEIGNKFGGSTLALAHLQDLLGTGRIIAIDIDHGNIHPAAATHSRIEFLEGDATALSKRVREMIGDDETVLVIEDSSHTYENTLNVLRGYCELIKPGGYFVVEDSICHHGLDTGPSPGAFEAIEEFLAEDDRFFDDREMESFVITWNPRGFLRRKAT